uniref:Uncharacterized protein n=1 Tax=Anguilla anguilla TaxID=7936 RepID=A0A0E9XU65_ANGAN
MSLVPHSLYDNVSFKNNSCNFFHFLERALADFSMAKKKEVAMTFVCFWLKALCTRLSSG